MTTRREKLESRLEKRKEWAAAREAKAAQRFDAAHAISDGIPFGQPILVGHHSEKHARRDQDKIASNMTAGCESADMAKHHATKAAGIARQLDRSIFSDDADAIEQLESRIAERETQCARMTALNKLIRKEMKAGLPEGWLDRIGATETEKRIMLENVKFDWRHEPLFPSYRMTNLRSLIRADKERIRAIQDRTERAQAAEMAGGCAIEEMNGYARVTFAEKPERAILDSLRAAGYYWGGGSWCGPISALPECVKSINGDHSHETPETQT